MRRASTAALLVLFAFVPLATPAAAQGAYGRDPAWQYERGYRNGFDDGTRDARTGRRFDRDERRFDRRSPHFENGYREGYRIGFDQFRGLSRGRRVPGPSSGRGRGGFQDPAFARGYSDGYARGQDDGRDRDRYDPVRHRDYRDAKDGYFRDYGARQAWENNYRAGFRQGYEEGYRDGTRRR